MCECECWFPFCPPRGRVGVRARVWVHGWRWASALQAPVGPYRLLQAPTGSYRLLQAPPASPGSYSHRAAEGIAEPAVHVAAHASVHMCTAMHARMHTCACAPGSHRRGAHPWPHSAGLARHCRRLHCSRRAAAAAARSRREQLSRAQVEGKSPRYAWCLVREHPC